MMGGRGGGDGGDGGGGDDLVMTAGLRLQELLARQLDTSLLRAEKVEFLASGESVRAAGGSAAGVQSLESFRQEGAMQTQTVRAEHDLRDRLRRKGLSEEDIEVHIKRRSMLLVAAASEANSAGKGYVSGKVDRKRRAHPQFLAMAQSERQAELAALTAAEAEPPEGAVGKSMAASGGIGRHAAEVEASLLAGASDLQGISHLGLSAAALRARRPLFDDIAEGSTSAALPMDRARESASDAKPRSASEVFAVTPPEVLDLATFIQGRKVDVEGKTSSAERPLRENRGYQVLTSGSSDTRQTRPGCAQELDACAIPPHDTHEDPPAESVSGTGSPTRVAVAGNSLPCISDAELAEGRMPTEAIRALQGGRFATYDPGSPSEVLYIKNLAKTATEADLVALFLRFQRPGLPRLVFRLMQRGRMKGQAFVTFPDINTAAHALMQVHGYMLRGQPLVISFGRTST
eukprot:SM000045S16214  [mRNA]  locus=s45:322187:324980:+ [translate_table: standard]